MRKNKLPSLVSILILTLITGVMWISFSIYRALTTKSSPAVPEEISNPLNPTLDSQTLKQIDSRIFLNDSQIPEISLEQSSPGPQASPQGIPIATPVPSPSPATGSATIP